MCPLFRGSTVHKEEDNLSIVDKMAGPNVSFTQRFHCTQGRGQPLYSGQNSCVLYSEDSLKTVLRRTSRWVPYLADRKGYIHCSLLSYLKLTRSLRVYGMRLEIICKEIYLVTQQCSLEDLSLGREGGVCVC